ncbi:MAG: helicase-exonuclease AddAB subunit AddA [Defluviitaleaceae bacterium]|nr:helicase-exonuclease AddAB subunit AddA [Defluviitaleaceae bacterium]
MRFTKEQARAIDIRNTDVLVSAGAGSGKTAVLVERVIRMITGREPVDVDRLLVVTFTDAAAGQMRQRVAAELGKYIKEHPNDGNTEKQLALMSKSNITTIHSFCLRLARRFFHKIDMDPGFRVADVTEIELLRAEILDELFEECYKNYYQQGDNVEFVRLAEVFDQKVGDENFRRLVLELHEFSRSCPDPAGWLAEKAAEYALPGGIEGSAWYGFFVENAKHTLCSIAEGLDKAVRLAQNPNLHPKYGQVLAADLENVRRADFALGQGFAVFCLVMEFEYETLPSARSKNENGTMSKEEIVELKEEIKGLRADYKKGIEDLRGAMVKQPDGLEADLRGNAGNMAALVQVVLEFSRRFQEAKREKNVADFGDFEHFCLEILFDGGELSAEALVIQSEFDEIFIDEYQDLSLIQEVILAAVSGRGCGVQNRFMVGDVKQCIYQFRNSRPEIFAEKAKRFLDVTESGTIINLAENFRSRVGVIDSVNYMFSRLMSEKAGGLGYDQRAFLQHAAEYDGDGDYRTVLHIIDGANDTESSDESDDVLEELTTAQIEGRVVAGYIRRLVAEGFKIKDGSGYRAIRLRDIVILLRSATAAQVYADELKNADIPTFYDSEKDYFLATEVMTALALLQIIDNPRQDIPLITVLHSAIFRFSPDELVQIRRAATGDFFGALVTYGAAGDDAELCLKVQDFLAKLEKWRDEAVFLTISQLIFHLYQETDFYNFVGLLPGGQVRRANLMLLFEKAAKYETTSFKGLFNFVRYIEKLQKNNFGFEQANVSSENEDLVRIMTIHKSKGLEFGVVFLCNMGKGFNLRDAGRDFVMDYDLGMGMKAVDLEQSIGLVSDTFARHVIGKKITAGQISEEMRVLYVAMTRAKEKLYLIGTAKNLGKKRGKGGPPRPYDALSMLKEGKIATNPIAWIRNQPSHSAIFPPGMKCKEYNVMKGRSFLDWVMMAVDPLGDAPGDWDICFSDRAAYNQEEQRKRDGVRRIVADIEDVAVGDHHSGYGEQVRQRLAYVYPHQGAIHAPAKMSVSEVKRLYYREFLADSADLERKVGREFLPPGFLRRDGDVDAAAKGIAVHTVLEHVDFEKTNVDDVAGLVEVLVDKGLLGREEADIVSVDSIVGFLNSDLAGRMRRSDGLRREIPFAVPIVPGEINAAFAEVGPGDMILHGVIDCVFEEAGGLVIVDYKTERVRGELAAVAEGYRLQMELYEYALEKIFGKRVVQRIIYFFDLGVGVEV